MMKNSEWGVAAYLSQSKYGIYGNTGKEVAQNANSSYKTGGENYTSNTAQSTTGNITGIYDMSGGAYEYVMGVLNETPKSSGFTTFPDEKYYNKYITEDATTACSSGIFYGHALSETSRWYSDSADFVSSSRPWFLRGGGWRSNNASVGVFLSYVGDGSHSSDNSFRIVLTPDA